MKQLGKYEILERIGEGGFGTVWKGRDPFLKRSVAIKLCTSDNDELRKRFLREAEIAGGLHHPNVTVVHDFGYHDDVPYMVQEFLSGEDLSVIIRRRDAVPQLTKLRWLTDIARGLEYAHSKGVIHRDVKPSNIRILESGVAKVMDFGIAKLAEMNTQGLTRTGTAMGTIGYMAPEQVNGDPVDHRADIFAYGVLAYELLSYVRPFEADTMSRVFYRILNENPQPLSDLVPLFPADLERVVLRCLAKDQHHRYGSFREVLHHLERIAGGEPLDEIAPGDPTEIAHPGARAAAAGEDPASAATVLRPPGSWTPPTGPTAALGGAPNTATAYAPPSPRRLSTALIVAAIVGGGIAGTAVLLVDRKAGPAPVDAAATAQLPAAAALPAPGAEDAAAGRERGRVLLEEARRLVAEGRPQAALDVAVDAVAADPESLAARALIEQLAETPAAAAPPAPAPVRNTPAPTRARPEPDTAREIAPPAPEPAAPPPAAMPAAVAVVPSQANAAPRPEPETPLAPATPEIDEKQAVAELLDRYARAYEALDAAAVARLWPGMGGDRQRGLAEAFAGYRWLELVLSDCAIEVDGVAATADCRMRQSFELKVGKAAPRESAVRFRLERTADGWRIADVAGR